MENKCDGCLHWRACEYGDCVKDKKIEITKGEFEELEEFRQFFDWANEISISNEVVCTPGDDENPPMYDLLWTASIQRLIGTGKTAIEAIKQANKKANEQSKKDVERINKNIKRIGNKTGASE